MTSKQPHAGDLSPDEFRRVGGDVIEAIAQYHAGLDRRRVLLGTSPSQRTEEEDIERTFEALAQTGHDLNLSSAG